MRSSRLIHIVGCHAEGEVGDVIVGGVAPPPGTTVWEQSRFLAQDNGLRQYILNEPRGGVFRHINLLVPPIHPDADMGFIIMEPEDTPPMSGSNSICVSTVLLETGIIEMHEPETELILEAPGGLVHVTAQCANGKVKSVRVLNLPSFADLLDASLEVEGVGTLKVDTAFGGDSFVVVDGPALGFGLTADEAADLAQMGIRITKAANDQLGFSHPSMLDWNHISFCQFAAPVEMVDGVLTGRNTVVIQPGKLDRSPTGTGCSARLAILYARGMIDVKQPFRGVSVIDSVFDCQIESVLDLDGKTSVRPSIRGRAWLTGNFQLMLDPSDPFQSGYRLSDTWPQIEI